MYQIYNYRSKRIRTDYIIICHAVDLFNSRYNPSPMLNQGSYKYTWGIWQNYWIRNINKYALPCHYFVELLDTDYVVFSGLPQFKVSYFIEDLVKQGIIDYRYKNAVLVVIGENFNLDIPEQRMLEHLSDKLLSRLVRDYHLDWSRIKLLDECLTLDWKIKQDILHNERKDHWIIQPMKYFDKMRLKQTYNKYCLFS